MKLKPILVAICVFIGTLGLLGYMHSTRQESQLVEAGAEILELRENLGKARAGILELRENLGKASDNIRALGKIVDILEKELKKAREGSRWELHDPTYKEVRNFVEEDKTDENEYVEGEYDCKNFAADFNKNAMKNGIQCAEVSITFEKGAHMIAAFDTVDRGLVYVEPHLDVVFQELEVGQEYWKIVEKYLPYEFIEEEDTIQRIVILW